MDKYSKLFIVGSPRSGTHWVRRIVAGHPNVINNDYESSIYKVIVGPFLFSRFFLNRSWRTVIKNYHSTHLNQWMDYDTFIGNVDRIKNTKGTNLEKSKRLIEIILDKYFYDNHGCESKILVEKTPDHIYYADIILDQFDNAMILEVIRDGRDVLKSLKSLRNKGSNWVPSRTSAQIKLWSNAIRQGIKLKSDFRFKSRWHTIRYEDLITQPAETTKSILKFANLPMQSNTIDDLISKSSTRPLGEKNRTSNVALNHFEKLKFYQLAGDLLDRLGY